MRSLAFLAFVALLVAVATCSAEDDTRASMDPTRIAQSGAPPIASAPKTTFDRCLEQLAATEEARVRRSVQTRYRLGHDDAADLVRDAMLAVCIRHGQRPYKNVNAVLQRAAENRARDDWRRKGRYPRCPIDNRLPSCAPGPDETARFEAEQRVVTAALCKEDRVSERIVRQRAMEELDFATIGADNGLSADDARTRYHNSIRRVQRRVAEACGL